MGSGTNVVDLTYVDNAAYAHLDASDALTGPDAPCAGRAYFVSNGEPVALWPWVNALLLELGIPPVVRRVPLPVARSAGFLLESAYRLFRLPGEPRMTPFLATAFHRSSAMEVTVASRVAFKNEPYQ